MKRFAIMAVILAFGSSGFAEEAATPKLEQARENQEHRIEQGEASGQLTGLEAERLENQQERLEKREEKMKEGGVTPKERARIAKGRERASRNIRHQKHDRQRRK